MTPRQHETILWRWTQQRTATAIAKELGVSRSAVLGFVYRARLAGDRRAAARVKQSPAVIRARLKKELASTEARAKELRQALGIAA